MSIKSVVKLYSKIINGELDEDTIMEAMGNGVEFRRLADLAQKVLEERITEKELVRYLLGVQKTSVAALMSQGKMSIFAADADGSLNAYTHTVVLTVIGALIEDEIL